jgi:hypothetical protein
MDGGRERGKREEGRWKERYTIYTKVCGHPFK